MKFIAIIGDIIGSQKILERNRVQEKLESILLRINKSDKNIISPYTLTLGDEFQSVYKKADCIFLHIFTILSDIHPQKVRFSIGIGEISTKINRNQAIGMDGTAFHFARKGILELKDTPYLFKVISEKNTMTKLLNKNLDLISHMINNWKKNRLLILKELLNGKSISEISKSINITNSAIYKNINSGALDTIVEIFIELSNTINHFVES